MTNFGFQKHYEKGCRLFMIMILYMKRLFLCLGVDTYGFADGF